MIGKISQKVYETLAQDSVLQGLLPDVKDGSNVWEMRVPRPADSGRFPAIAFRVVSGSPLLEVKSLNAFNWFIEIDIVGNTASMTQLWQIYDRVYQLLEDRNMTTDEAVAYRCQLDFFNTDYDQNTLTNFILCRYQLYSLEIPSSKLGNLS